MNIRTLFLGVAIVLGMACTTLSAWSKQVDENTAHKVAVQMLTRNLEAHIIGEETQFKAQTLQKTVKLLYKSSNITENVETRAKDRTTVDEIVYFYVFVTEDNSSSVIVAGDDRVQPILGYSHTNGFSVDNMPDNVKWWLGEYAKQIEYAIENDIESTQEAKLQWENYLKNVENNKK